MFFRKQEILFIETIIFLCMLLSASLFILSFDFWYFLLSFFGFLLVLTLCIISPEEYILIDDTGISNHLKNDCLWKYSWDEIADLRISKRYRQKAIEIFLKSTKEEDKLEYSHNYFQYGKKAKKALAIYYPKEIKKLKRGLVNGEFID
ncbi:MAG: hypothetical protein E7557_01105 [Ruminococcaceae bacterium]|nr:hypothetical protein [Oscillospiraceae bacterium]